MHNPKTSKGGSGSLSTFFGQLIANHALSKFSPSQLLDALQSDTASRSVAEGNQVVLQTDSNAFDSLLEGVSLSQPDAAFFTASQSLVYKLRLEAGTQAFIVNGRVSSKAVTLML